MAAISADSGNEKRWGRTVSFNLSAGAEKAKKAASNTVQYSQQLLWSTGKAAWIAGASFLVLVVPLIVQMDRNAQNTVDLEVGASTPPASSSSPAVK